MYSVSPGFLTSIKSNSRDINARITIGTTVIPVESIIKFSIEESFGSNKMPTIGGATSSILNLEITNTSIAGKIIINTPIIPEVAILIGSLYEWIPLGTFYADSTDITLGKVTTTLICLDKMDLMDGYIYSSTLTFPTTVGQMITDLSANYPIIFETGITNLTDVVNEKPEGTIRQVLSKIAFRLGTNVLFNRVGKCTFRFLSNSGFTFNAENYFEYKLLSGSPNRISQLTLLQSNDDANPIIVGDTSGLKLEMTSTVINNQADLQVIFNRVYPLNFYSYTMTVQGMPHLEVGDIYDFVDVDSNLYKFTVVYHKLEFDGGLKSTFEVSNPQSQKDSLPINQTTGTIGDSIVQVSRSLTQAISTSTSLITGNMGGHVRLKLDNAGKPEEILILIDSEDINTATKLWRWNAGGLGYSDTGYNGTYKLAMTSDGSIVATMITSGILNANIIQAGRIQSPNGLSYWDLDTGEIVLVVSSISINASGEILPVATTEDVDNAVSDKASNNDLNVLSDVVSGLANEVLNKASNGELQDLIDSYNEKLAQDIIDKKAVSDSLATLQGRTVVVENILGDKSALWTFLETSITQSEEGIFVGNASTKMGVLIGTNRISFMDNGIEVAYISGQTMKINNGIFVQSAIIGKHKIETISGTDITVFVYVG